MKIIDPHVHLFDVHQGSYHWLKSDNPPFWSDKIVINRTFTQDDIRLEGNNAIVGFVHIEAGFDNDAPWREIAWLERTITKPFKSIASIDVTLKTCAFLQALDKLLSFKSVVGVRHIFDDQTVDILAEPQVLANLASLAKHQLIFETQIYNDNPSVQAFVNIAKRLPLLTFIISHSLFFPQDIKRNVHWSRNIYKLALCENVNIKASGWEMVERDFQIADINDAMNVILDAFSVDRVLLASNFPLCLFSQTYESLWQQYMKLPFDSCVLEQLAYGNACKVYGF